MLNLQGEDLLLLPQKPKHSLLPVLTVLFLISYGLLAMLVVEQGKTIDTQRYLINQLFTDSVQLTAMKGTAVQKQQAEAREKAQAQSSIPSMSATPHDKLKGNHHAGTLQRPLPQKPPKDTADVADERRSLLSI